MNNLTYRRHLPCCGIPSVMLNPISETLTVATRPHTRLRGQFQLQWPLRYLLLREVVCSVSMSVIPCYDFAYGTNIAEAVAPVSFTASRTLAKTGLSRCVSPAFFGFVPPTTFVPELRYSCPYVATRCIP